MGSEVWADRWVLIFLFCLVTIFYQILEDERIAFRLTRLELIVAACKHVASPGPVLRELHVGRDLQGETFLVHFGGGCERGGGLVSLRAFVKLNN